MAAQVNREPEWHVPPVPPKPRPTHLRRMPPRPKNPIEPEVLYAPPWWFGLAIFFGAITVALGSALLWETLR